MKRNTETLYKINCLTNCKIKVYNYLHKNINIFWNIVNFQQYSWYVNMYIGLFILIPFLNTIWQNLKTEKQKKYLNK